MGCTLCADERVECMGPLTRVTQARRAPEILPPQRRSEKGAPAGQSSSTRPGTLAPDPSPSRQASRRQGADLQLCTKPYTHQLEVAPFCPISAAQLGECGKGPSPGQSPGLLGVPGRQARYRPSTGDVKVIRLDRVPTTAHGG
jgi:hypothetical protein